jgi:hypothetical protein
VQGKYEGKTTSNDMWGQYELYESSKMKVVSVCGSLVGEQEWGDKFWYAMYQVNSYDIKGNRLFIYFNDGSEKIEWERQ